MSLGAIIYFLNLPPEPRTKRYDFLLTCVNVFGATPLKVELLPVAYEFGLIFNPQIRNLHECNFLQSPLQNSLFSHWQLSVFTYGRFRFEEKLVGIAEHKKAHIESVRTSASLHRTQDGIDRKSSCAWCFGRV